MNWAEATSVLETSAPPSLISFIYLFILFIADWNHNLTYVKRMLHHRVSLLLPTILSYIPLFSFVCLLKTVSLAAQPVLRSQDPWFCCTSIGYHQTWHWLPSLFLVLSLLLPCLEVRICWYIPQASLQLAILRFQLLKYDYVQCSQCNYTPPHSGELHALCLVFSTFSSFCMSIYAKIASRVLWY